MFPVSRGSYKTCSPSTSIAIQVNISCTALTKTYIIVVFDVVTCTNLNLQRFRSCAMSRDAQVHCVVQPRSHKT